MKIKKVLFCLVFGCPGANVVFYILYLYAFCGSVGWLNFRGWKFAI